VAKCSIFPADHVWNTPVQELPVNPSSAEYVAAIGPDSPLHPDFGSGLWEGRSGSRSCSSPAPDSRAGRIRVCGRVTRDRIIPPDAPIEGGSEDGDRHILMVDPAVCRLYELYSAYPQADGSGGLDRAPCST
jgi:hypothetical protein